MAEKLAAAYLRYMGLIIQHHNFRCPYGEIDLIARDGGTLCFIEVRSRSSARFLSPIVSITTNKQRRIADSAQHFLCSRSISIPCRFDVVEVLTGNSEDPHITWTRDAFRVSGDPERAARS